MPKSTYVYIGLLISNFAKADCTYLSSNSSAFSDSLAFPQKNSISISISKNIEASLQMLKSKGWNLADQVKFKKDMHVKAITTDAFLKCAPTKQESDHIREMIFKKHGLDADGIPFKPLFTHAQTEYEAYCKKNAHFTPDKSLEECMTDLASEQKTATYNMLETSGSNLPGDIVPELEDEVASTIEKIKLDRKCAEKAHSSMHDYPALVISITDQILGKKEKLDLSNAKILGKVKIENAKIAALPLAKKAGRVVFENDVPGTLKALMEGANREDVEKAVAQLVSRANDPKISYGTYGALMMAKLGVELEIIKKLPKCSL